jgi:hypothetical protein
LIKIIDFLVKCSFKDIKDFDKNKSQDTSKFIMDSILNLSWFFKIPISIYLYTLQSLAIFIKFKSINKFTDQQQYYFYSSIFVKLPFSNSIEKLIRTLGFMNLYDEKRNE